MSVPSSPSEIEAHDSAEARELRANLVSELQAIGDLSSVRVREALLRVPRHVFAPSWVPLPRAYANRALAIGYGQTISQPPSSPS